MGRMGGGMPGGGMGRMGGGAGGGMGRMGGGGMGRMEAAASLAAGWAAAVEGASPAAGWAAAVVEGRRRWGRR